MGAVASRGVHWSLMVYDLLSNSV